MEPVNWEQGKLKVLVYGIPGSGKTTFTASVLDHPDIFGDVLWLNAAGNPIVMKDRETKPIVLNLTQLPDLMPAYQWFQAGAPKDHAFAKHYGLDKGEHPYGTIVLDTISHIQHLIFQHTTKVYLPGQVPDKKTFNHYGNLKNGLQVIAESFFEKLNAHVIITGWEMYDESSERYRVSLEGQMKYDFSGYATFAGRIQRVQDLHPTLVKQYSKDHYNVLVTNAPSIDWKNQYGRQVPTIIPSPTAKGLYDLLIGE